jgi:hypothetical protein
MKLLIRDHDNLFVLSEVAHFSGIGFLVYKLLRVESCEGACAAARKPRVVLRRQCICVFRPASRRAKLPCVTSTPPPPGALDVTDPPRTHA